MIADLANIPTDAMKTIRVLVLLSVLLSVVPVLAAPDGPTCAVTLEEEGGSQWVWVWAVIGIVAGIVAMWLLLELLWWLRCRKDLRRRQQEQDAKEARWEA